MWAIIGLGNPGRRYRWSRHNIGFCVLDSAADYYKIKFRRNSQIPSFTGRGAINSKQVILVKPLTYMNQSGLAVKAVQETYNIGLDKILVILDDVALLWGRFRLRVQGSSGGHKGLESVIMELNSSDFPRLRMGIGMPKQDGHGLIEHVLSSFTAEEKLELDAYCKSALSAVELILDNGIETAMNAVNKKNFGSEGKQKK